MYERTLVTFRNGIRTIDISIDDHCISETSQESSVCDSLATEIPNASITITFAVTTDSEAWITVCADGQIHIAFGGTGMREKEIASYVATATMVGDVVFKHNVDWQYENVL